MAEVVVEMAGGWAYFVVIPTNGRDLKSVHHAALFR